MWLKVATVVLLGVTLAGNSIADDSDLPARQQGGHDKQATIRPVQEMRHVRTPTVQEMHRAVTPQVQENRQPVTTHVQEIRQPITTRVEKEGQRNTRVREDAQWVDRGSERYDRLKVRIGSYDGQPHREFNDSRGSISIYYPNYGYSYYGYPNATYPKIYFICYEEDQVDEDRFHISCPYPTAWYSTAPVYSSFQYQSNYRPEYVCPRVGASHYIEFKTIYEANTWSYRNCNRWQYDQNSLDDEDY